MSISSLCSISSNGSSRKSSVDRPAIGGRKLSIEILPNQSIFRETFLGVGVPRLHSPITTPLSEEPPALSPSYSTGGGSHFFPPSSQACAACCALGPRDAQLPSPFPGNKRHAVILPTRHHGPHCRMPPPPTGALPALPSIGEDCLVEWERKGSTSMAPASPTSTIDSTPLASPVAVGPTNYDYFASSAGSSALSVVAEEVEPVGAMPSPRIGSFKYKVTSTDSLFPSPHSPSRKSVGVAVLSPQIAGTPFPGFLRLL